MFSVEEENSKGGLAIFWNHNWNWTVVPVSSWILGILVELEGQERWTCWFRYCLADRLRRKEFWENLTTKVKAGANSSVCLGDFNDVVNHEKKLGGKPVSSKSNYFLQKFMFNIGAIDLGFHDQTFT